MRKSLVIALIVATLAGGVAFAAIKIFQPEEDLAVRYVPEDALAYGSLFLDPGNAQKIAIEDLLSRFPNADDPEQAGDLLVDLFNEALAAEGLTFEDDIEPWFGDQLAFFAEPPSLLNGETNAAALIGVIDSGKAHSFLAGLAKEEAGVQEATYQGFKYFREDDFAVGVVDDFLVAGTEGGLKSAVDAHTGESLADSDRFQEVADSLEEDRVALFFLDLGPIMQFAQMAGGDLGFLGFDEPFGAVIYTRSNGLVFETSTGAGPGEGDSPGLLPELPDSAWGAIGLTGMGDQIREFYEGLASSAIPGVDLGAIADQFRQETGLDLEADVLGWIEDGGLFIAGRDEPDLGGGAVLSTNDPDATARAVKVLERVLEKEGEPVGPSQVEGYEGFTIKSQVEGVPESVTTYGPDFHVVYSGNLLFAGVGERYAEQVLTGEATLADDPTFEDAGAALGEGFTISVFLNIDTVTEIAEAAGASTDEIYVTDVKPFLDPISFIAAGSKKVGDRVTQRLLIGVP